MSALTLLQTKVRTYPRLLWILGLGIFIQVAGHSFLWPITSIYIHQELGRPVAVAGLVLFLHSGASALGSLVGGYLFDRIGARPVLVTGLFLSSGLMGLLGIFQSWPLYVGVMILFGFTISPVFPVLYALSAKSWPEGGRQGFNFLYVMTNLGVAVGTALGGLVAARSFQLAFLSAGTAFFLFALLVLGFVHDNAQPGATTAAASSGTVQVERPVPWTPILALFVGFLTLWLVYVQWQSSLSVYMQTVGIDLPRYSLLWTMNGLIIVLGQPLLAAVLRGVPRLITQLYLGIALYVGAFGLLLTSNSYAVFAVGMAILTFGEMLLWPGVPAAVERLAPPSRRGFLQGFINSGATVGRMVGPLLGGLIYDMMGYRSLLIGMTALLAVPVVAFMAYSRTAR